MKPWTRKHTLIAIAAALLVVGAQALVQLARDDAPSRGGTTRAVVVGGASSSDFDASDTDSVVVSSDAGADTANAGAEPLPSSDASDTTPWSAGGALSGDAGPSSDGSDAVTQGYWDRQATQDGVIRDMDNSIKDEVTLQNPETGETMQGQAGSDQYYQSPSVDAAMGESTIVGADGGSTPPADATQLNVVTGGDSGGASSSDAGGTP
jgi:hypothetical protein